MRMNRVPRGTEEIMLKKLRPVSRIALLSAYLLFAACRCTPLLCADE